MPPNNKKVKGYYCSSHFNLSSCSNSKQLETVYQLFDFSFRLNYEWAYKNTSDVHFYGFFPSFSHYELIVGGFKKNEYFIQRKETYMHCIYLGQIWLVYVKGLMQEFSNHYLAKSQLILNLSNLSCKHWMYIYMYIRLISHMKFCVKT